MWQGHRLCLCGSFWSTSSPSSPGCPRSPAVTAVLPLAFPGLDECIPKPQSGACREGAPLRHAPPAALLSGFAAPAPEECAGLVPTAAAGAARPQRSPPRPLVPAATSRCHANHGHSPPSSSLPWTQPEVPAETWPGRAAPEDLPPPRRAEAGQEVHNKLWRAGNARGGSGPCR